jgi:hypothetical protein
MEKEIIFSEGIYLNKVADTAPDFVKANVSIHADKAIAWLQTMKATGMVNEKGYVNLVGKESKGGKRYFQLDTYKPKTDAAQEVTQSEETPF